MCFRYKTAQVLGSNKYHTRCRTSIKYVYTARFFFFFNAQASFLLDTGLGMHTRNYIWTHIPPHPPTHTHIHHARMHAATHQSLFRFPTNRGVGCVVSLHMIAQHQGRRKGGGGGGGDKEGGCRTRKYDVEGGRGGRAPP